MGATSYLATSAEALFRARCHRNMARFAMPAVVRPDFKLLARCAVLSARNARLLTTAVLL